MPAAPAGVRPERALGAVMSAVPETSPGGPADPPAADAGRSDLYVVVGGRAGAPSPRSDRPTDDGRPLPLGRVRR